MLSFIQQKPTNFRTMLQLVEIYKFIYGWMYNKVMTKYLEGFQECLTIWTKLVGSQIHGGKHYTFKGRQEKQNIEFLEEELVHEGKIHMVRQRLHVNLIWVITSLYRDELDHRVRANVKEGQKLLNHFSRGKLRDKQLLP